MNRILTATLLIAALAVSACTNPDLLWCGRHEQRGRERRGPQTGVSFLQRERPGATAFPTSIGDRVLFLDRPIY